MKNSPLRTPLSNARGLGSAKDGTHHWWLQRLTAIALIPLGSWFAYALVSTVAKGDLVAVRVFFTNPYVALTTLAMIIAGFWHAKLGMQVVIEDYVHCPVKKITLLLLNAFGFLALGLISALAVIKLHFGV